MKSFFAKILPSALFLFLIALSVHASGGDTAPITIANPFGHGSTLDELLTAIINNIVLPIGAIIAVLMFIWTGFLFVTSGGDKSKVGKARESLINASIGTAVLLGAWVIQAIIKSTIDSLQT